jgi:hypothetical protein
MSDTTPDIELDAIRTIITVLQPLSDESRKRVVNYISERFGISYPTLQRDRLRRSLESGKPTILLESTDTSITSATDIRQLKEIKMPETASEMAVLVAYYLSELATDEERKASVNSADIEKYFKQAKFPLPKSLKDVLPDSKKAGFLDSITHGEYKLTSVGYNLAVHGLPRNKSS